MPPFAAKYAIGGPVFAQGGSPMERAPDGSPGIGNNQMFPQANISGSEYSVASQTPQDRAVLRAGYGGPVLNPSTGDQQFAAGGLAALQGGGRAVVGPGDGMSDDVPADIEGVQPARLAQGEFVVPADVVSHLGNGSTQAGVTKLDGMMARIRKARTGNAKQGKKINADRMLG